MSTIWRDTGLETHTHTHTNTHPDTPSFEYVDVCTHAHADTDAVDNTFLCGAFSFSCVTLPCIMCVSFTTAHTTHSSPQCDGNIPERWLAALVSGGLFNIGGHRGTEAPPPPAILVFITPRLSEESVIEILKSILNASVGS